MVVTDKNGVLIADTGNPQRNLNTLSELGDPGLSSLFSGPSGEVEVALAGKDYVANVYAAPESGWRYAGCIEKGELMEPARRTVTAIALVALGSLVLLIGVLWFFMNRSVIRPLGRVGVFLRDIGAGRYASRLESVVTVVSSASTALSAQLGQAARGAAVQAGVASRNLREIVALADSTADQIRAIATASEQQSATSEEITRTIEAISDITAETAQAMRHSIDAVAALTGQVAELLALIENMQADGRAMPPLPAAGSPDARFPRQPAPGRLVRIPPGGSVLAKRFRAKGHPRQGVALLFQASPRWTAARGMILRSKAAME